MATDSVELLALQRIDETCMQLQQQGNYLQALECMERGLVLRQHFFGSDSDEVWSACKIVGEMCNLLAMTYLQQEDFGMVLELLKKAEILTERDDAGRAVTYNNLACYYRRRGKLHSALQYLHKALKIEAKMGSRVEHPADTHLNTCAVLSQIGRHQGALEHAQSALILLQEELFGGGAAVAEVGAGGRVGDQPPRADRIAVLAIAYHNMGVEQEFLKKFEHSLQSYRKGVEVSQKYLGGNHAVTVTLRNSTMAARRAISARDSKIREELTRRSNRKPRGGGGGGERGGRPGPPKSNVGTGLLNHALSTASYTTQKHPNQHQHQHQEHQNKHQHQRHQEQNQQQQQQQQQGHRFESLHESPHEEEEEGGDEGDAGRGGGGKEGDYEKGQKECDERDEKIDQDEKDQDIDQEEEEGRHENEEKDDKDETDRVARGLMDTTALEPTPPPVAAAGQATAAMEEDLPLEPSGDFGKSSNLLGGGSALGGMISPRPPEHQHEGAGVEAGS